MVLLILAACSDNGAGPDADEGLYPDSMLSYTLHIQPIFLEDCAASGICHQASLRAGGLDLESNFPTFLGSSGPVIFPLSAPGSLLYQLLFQRVGTIPRMPSIGPPLSDAKIRAIGTWIDEGANISAGNP